MTVTHIEPQVTDGSTSEYDPIHLACHCTNYKVAFCGEPLRGEPAEFEEDLLCPMCEVLDEGGVVVCSCPCNECAP